MFSLGKSAVACSSLLQASTAVAAATTTATRGVARIPHWEYHIRFSPKDGRKRPAQDVLDRYAFLLLYRIIYVYLQGENADM